MAVFPPVVSGLMTSTTESEHSEFDLVLQPDMDVINGNYKLAGIDLEKILTPAAELRPGAAQTCVQRQVSTFHSCWWRCDVLHLNSCFSEDPTRA